MKTYKQYMNKECTHRQYYAQFVDVKTRRIVLNAFGLDRIKKHIEADDCFHRDNIPLKMWDRLSGFHVRGSDVTLMGGNFVGNTINWKKAKNESFSLSDCVCILKEAAKQIAESEQQKKQ